MTVVYNMTESKESRQKYKDVTLLFVFLSQWKAVVKKVDVERLKTLMGAMTFYNPDDTNYIPQFQMSCRDR